MAEAWERRARRGRGVRGVAEAWQRRARRDRGVGEACEAWVRHGSLSAAQKTCPLVACRGLVPAAAVCAGAPGAYVNSWLLRGGDSKRWRTRGRAQIAAWARSSSFDQMLRCHELRFQTRMSCRARCAPHQPTDEQFGRGHAQPAHACARVRREYEAQAHTRAVPAAERANALREIAEPDGELNRTRKIESNRANRCELCVGDL